MNIIIRDYESVLPHIDLKINVGHCGPLILRYILKTLPSYFGIMGQYDQTFDLKINIRHCDLYFMVQ